MTTKEELKAELEELRERKRVLEEGEDTESYDDMLNSYGPVKIAGLEFDASRIVAELDPIAYRCGLNDYNDSELSELEEQIGEKEEEIKGATE
jgi:hypothetical protein